MADYKSMYLIAFSGITEAISRIDESSYKMDIESVVELRNMLSSIQRQTEEIYIDSEDAQIIPFEILIKSNIEKK